MLPLADSRDAMIVASSAFASVDSILATGKQVKKKMEPTADLSAARCFRP